MKFNNTATCKVIQPSFPSCTAVQPARVGGLHGVVACTEGRFIREREKRPEAFGFTYFLTLSIYEQYDIFWLSAQLEPVLLWP